MTVPNVTFRMSRVSGSPWNSLTTYASSQPSRSTVMFLRPFQSARKDSESLVTNLHRRRSVAPPASKWCGTDCTVFASSGGVPNTRRQRSRYSSFSDINAFKLFFGIKVYSACFCLSLIKDSRLPAPFSAHARIHLAYTTSQKPCIAERTAASRSACCNFWGKGHATAHTSSMLSKPPMSTIAPKAWRTLRREPSFDNHGNSPCA
mmetsp:Transcript_15802/g.45630  ORF Transcript_15802/g.45630 Transcript_15802/m.45630 type:complete len:205 (-) Transcript_15802:356-970(-)